ncbi:hypothetical protein AeRB84_012499 [Aphanomyces euteiches]|nr:hypothetical protein AeRB84_012499 [Aphanomyces euteiches]
MPSLYQLSHTLDCTCTLSHTLDSMLANFDAVQWFLSLDNASGFCVLRSTRRARLISAFMCPLGHFKWTRMAQGLKNAPMIYQRMITNAMFGFVDLPPGVADLDEDGEPRDIFKINYKYPEEIMPAPTVPLLPTTLAMEQKRGMVWSS